MLEVEAENPGASWERCHSGRLLLELTQNTKAERNLTDHLASGFSTLFIGKPRDIPRCAGVCQGCARGVPGVSQPPSQHHFHLAFFFFNFKLI